MTRTQALNISATVCRIVLALVFIFSGFVKSVDPWGTAIKVNEYLLSFGWDWAAGYHFGFAILLCGAELMLGVMMLVGVYKRLVSLLTMIAMVVFTAITLYIAYWGAVEDCGCFGDAVKLTNHQTFYKNLVLLPMAVWVWLRGGRERLFYISKNELIKSAVIACLSFGVGIYCYRHLPIIDFLPYKEGVNLRSEVIGSEGEVRAIFVCRNLQSGEMCEFSDTDTTWYDSSVWEFVESREVSSQTRNMSLAEFSIFNSEGSYTEEILGYEGRTHLVCILKFDMLTESCRERLSHFVGEAVGRGERVIAITADNIDNRPRVEFAQHNVPIYNIDATTLITMLRAKTGVVTLNNGVIEQKRNCRDVQ